MEYPTTPWTLIRATSHPQQQSTSARKPTVQYSSALDSCLTDSYRMSESKTSPKASFDFEERPGSGHTNPVAGSGHTRSMSGDVNPRNRSPQRRSIQFSIGATKVQLPTRSTRSSSMKEKSLSYGDTPTRDLEREKDPRATQLTRGPSPPPPKYASFQGLS